ncbi:hypothetical protein [Tepidibacter formicigenes]|jgi:hypothetical protein|uniref:Uncharacterized protein n=1 Tax=Tepidibacter formicigenes DSM 15518 TaxID=1123349 RepID=A0A1M6SNR4_9FIRM|nr:hypothetical protein [Tepidibacter formicigenes]SHK46248.1 hypothetical protein SAMN02744037_02391 [Tepidibacter formicigenes DSM 15518]
MLKCKICGKGIKNTNLIVIDRNYYCIRCLKKLIKKATKGKGRYYTHLQDRIFISFIKEGKMVVDEFRLSELITV